MAMKYPSESVCGGNVSCKFFDIQNQNGKKVCICNIVNRQLNGLGECPWEKYEWQKKNRYSLNYKPIEVECYGYRYYIMVDLKELIK